MSTHCTRDIKGFYSRILVVEFCYTELIHSGILLVPRPGNSRRNGLSQIYRRKEMTDLKRKVRVRAGHKVVRDEDYHRCKGTHQFWRSSRFKKLKSLQSILRGKLAEINGLDREIADETKEECIDQEAADSYEFASAVYECIVDIEALCGEKEKSAKESQPSGSGSIPSQLVTPAIGSAPTKLPKLELKKFYGYPVEWAPFWDSFNSAVHQNSSISDVNKFNYLKSLIHGQAANTISGFSLTGENYKEAVRLLKERYGNKQVLISALLKLPVATSISETKKLRDIYDKLESHVRSLQNIGIGAETYGSFLSPVVMSKIPEDCGSRSPGGGGVLPYMGYIDMCRGIGYGF